MSEVKVHVTQDDIYTAISRRKSDAMMNFHCPIATAMSRVLFSSVSIDGVNWRFAESLQYNMLPPVAVEFISAFDSQNYVTPITFAIEV